MRRSKYEVTLWYHLGLDKPDMEKFYSYGAGFRAWFVLQHLCGYKPFITKVHFTKEFNGNINIGKSELEEIKKENEKQNAQKWAEEEQQRIRREPKF